MLLPHALPLALVSGSGALRNPGSDSGSADQSSGLPVIWGWRLAAGILGEFMRRSRGRVPATL